jgi:hypothetical protein
VIDKEDFANGVVNLNDTYCKRARAALRLDARTETELGTLRAYAQINFDFDANQSEDPGVLDRSGTDYGSCSARPQHVSEIFGVRVW